MHVQSSKWRIGSHIYIIVKDCLILKINFHLVFFAAFVTF